MRVAFGHSAYNIPNICGASFILGLKHPVVSRTEIISEGNSGGSSVAPVRSIAFANTSDDPQDILIR